MNKPAKKLKPVKNDAKPAPPAGDKNVFESLLKRAVPPQATPPST